MNKAECLPFNGSQSLLLFIRNRRKKKAPWAERVNSGEVSICPGYSCEVESEEHSDSVSLGLRLPPSGSGCLSPEGEGLQPAISVQSFVLCAGLAAPLRTTRVPEPEQLGPGSSAQGRPLIVPGGTT